MSENIYEEINLFYGKAIGGTLLFEQCTSGTKRKHFFFLNHKVYCMWCLPVKSASALLFFSH